MLFADTADLKELEEMLGIGIFNGVTTNQKILLTANPPNYHKHLQTICDMSPGDVSVELTGAPSDYNGLVAEAVQLHSINPEKVVIKVPMWKDGSGVALAHQLQCIHEIPVNMTCLMSVNQAIAGCLAEARYVSLFYNRMKDYYKDQNSAESVIQYTRQLIDRFGWGSRIIAGSIRDTKDVAMCLLMGADIVTVPYKIYKQLFYNEATEKTIAEFDAAWAEYRKRR
jgi:transaldolase